MPVGMVTLTMSSSPVEGGELRSNGSTTSTMLGVVKEVVFALETALLRI